MGCGIAGPIAVRTFRTNIGRQTRLFHQRSENDWYHRSCGAELTSEIRWDDPKPWGCGRTQPNTFLRLIGTNPITPNEQRRYSSGASHFVVMDMMKPIVSAKKGGPRPKPLPTFDTFADAKKAIGKNKSLSVHAVTKGGNSVLLLRSLWLEYDKLGVQS